MQIHHLSLSVSVFIHTRVEELFVADSVLGFFPSCSPLSTDVKVKFVMHIAVSGQAVWDFQTRNEGGRTEGERERERGNGGGGNELCGQPVRSDVWGIL